MTTPELLTVREVAQICRVHEVTIRRHIRQGLLRSVRVGRQLRIPRDDLDRYVQQSGGEDDRRRHERSDVSRDIHSAIGDAIYEHKFSAGAAGGLIKFQPGFLGDLGGLPGREQWWAAKESSRSANDHEDAPAGAEFTLDDPFFKWIRAIEEEFQSEGHREVHRATDRTSDKRD
jgi:excisionase family DNA binding protein